MDNPTAMAPESPKSPQQPNLLWTPEINITIDHWIQTGQFPFPELRVYPQPQWSLYPKTDLRLIHHLSSISNEMFRNNTSKLTIWTDMMPKFLSIAATHPFVMHSILAFSASHLAWISQSSETRTLAVQHASIGLKGLHEGIQNFTKANSDAVLASSLLLAWQANEWRGWASLVTGTTTVIQAMQQWRHESMFAEYIAEHSPMRTKSYMNSISSPITEHARVENLRTISNIYDALQRLHTYLNKHDQESKWIDQLRGYLDRLRTMSPAQTAEDQFAQLYALRKWLFWVPISLLAAKSQDVTVLLVLAHFYATALALEPLFRELGSVFCADLALPPLEEIIHLVRENRGIHYESRSPAISYMIQFPADMASSYKERRDWARQPTSDGSPVQPQFALETLNLEIGTHISPYSYSQSLSPAFAPSPLTFIPSGMASGQTSPFLEVPRQSIDNFAVATSSYASPLGSPATVLPPYSMPEERPFSFGMPPMGYHPSGFVATPIWT